MKVTIESTFHANMSETFTGLNAGANYRKLKVRDTDGCFCGWPFVHTTKKNPKGWKCEIAPMPSAGEIRISLTKEGRQ